MPSKVTKMLKQFGIQKILLVRITTILQRPRRKPLLPELRQLLELHLLHKHLPLLLPEMHLLHNNRPLLLRHLLLEQLRPLNKHQLLLTQVQLVALCKQLIN
jgi:hypothetical protein